MCDLELVLRVPTDESIRVSRLTLNGSPWPQEDYDDSGGSSVQVLSETEQLDVSSIVEVWTDRDEAEAANHAAQDHAQGPTSFPLSLCWLMCTRGHLKEMLCQKKSQVSLLCHGKVTMQVNWRKLPWDKEVYKREGQHQSIHNVEFQE